MTRNNPVFNSILERIVDNKKIALASRKEAVPLSLLEARLSSAPPLRPVVPVLRRPGEVALITEIKKASPSKGIIRPDCDPVEIARVYAASGAAAISVLTEEAFFLGHDSCLTAVRQVTGLPLLRKDFIIDPYQIYESRLLGADMVLLIAAILPGGELAECKKLADDLSLACLVEVHDEGELERALAAGAELIGVNNRDLRTFQTDLGATFRLRRLIEDDSVTVVSESGIKNRGDIVALREAGVHAALVGEALMRRPDIGAALRELMGYGGPA
ncbi:MAG: indole-3-glycerol phosphate synthase TrpC [Peptococcaceae bacterium]|nr:MAG: indole-3-glycerol phosphate synthase TrpC [Peptococcaceae bacterium]